MAIAKAASGSVALKVAKLSESIMEGQDELILLESSSEEVGVTQEAIRRLRAIVTTKRLKRKWSDNVIIKRIELLLNSLPLSERGNYSAHELTYGSKDLLRFHLLKSFKARDVDVEDWRGVYSDQL